LFWTRAGLVEVDPAGGKVRFQFPRPSRSHASVNAAAPLVIGDLGFFLPYGSGPFSGDSQLGGLGFLTAKPGRDLWAKNGP